MARLSSRMRVASELHPTCTCIRDASESHLSRGRISPARRAVDPARRTGHRDQFLSFRWRETNFYHFDGERSICFISMRRDQSLSFRYRETNLSHVDETLRGTNISHYDPIKLQALPFKLYSSVNSTASRVNILTAVGSQYFDSTKFNKLAFYSFSAPHIHTRRADGGGSRAAGPGRGRPGRGSVPDSDIPKAEHRPGDSDGGPADSDRLGFEQAAGPAARGPRSDSLRAGRRASTREAGPARPGTASKAVPVNYRARELPGPLIIGPVNDRARERPGL